MNETLIIMSKAPIPGRVKTRLSPSISPSICAQLHEAFLRDTVRNAALLSGTRLIISYAPDSSLSFFRNVAPNGCELVPQGAGNLGQRMHRCFERHCSSGTPTVMIGSDSPTLPVEYIGTAFHLLHSDQTDIVFGPAEDGGYYLLGMTSPHESLFANMEWSTASVLRMSIDRCAKAGLRWSLLPEWYDVDTPEDLARLANALLSPNKHATCATKTLSVIKSLFANDESGGLGICLR